MCLYKNSYQKELKWKYTFSTIRSWLDMVSGFMGRGFEDMNHKATSVCCHYSQPIYCDMMLTHWAQVTIICVSEPGHHWIRLSETMLTYCQIDNKTYFNEKLCEIQQFSFKDIWRCRLQNGGYFVPAVMCQYGWDIRHQHNYLCKLID